MLRYIIMIVTCLLVTGAMAGVFFWFTKRLHNIEVQRWGKKTADMEMDNAKDVQEKSKK